MYIEYVLCVYTLVLILVGSCRLADACIQYVCMNFYDVYIYNNILYIYIIFFFFFFMKESKYIYYPFIIEVIVEVVTIRHCMIVHFASCQCTYCMYLCLCM